MKADAVALRGFDQATGQPIRIGIWRILAAIAGTMVTGTAAVGLHDPLASMASYAAALMALNQVAPPLLLLALPRGIFSGRSHTAEGSVFLGVCLGPFAATTLFVGLSIAVSLPGIFDPSVANALYTAPLVFWSWL